MNYYRRFNNQIFTGLVSRYFHSDLKYPNFDKYRRNSGKNPNASARKADESRKLKPALVTYALAVAAMVGGKWHAWHYLRSMSASADVLALSKIEVKTEDIEVDQCKIFKWRGKPLFIWHRSPEMIERERAVPLSELMDPEKDEDRCSNQDWLVVLGVCTHLGCVPIHHQGDYFGFYCPCHGSHFDGAGRRRKGPAPLNLTVPPHIFHNDLIIVG